VIDARWLGWVALGGALGTLARALLGEVAATAGWGAWGTLFVNSAGAFVAGWWMARRLGIRGQGLLVTGFLGGFTTFSALAQELAAQPAVLAVGDGAVALTCGLVAVGLGHRWGTAIPRRGGR
jgi:fluoride exporter